MSASDGPFTVPIIVGERVVPILVSGRCNSADDWPLHKSQIASALTPYRLNTALTDAADANGPIVMHWLASTLERSFAQAFLPTCNNAKELVDKLDGLFGAQAAAVASKNMHLFMSFQQERGEPIMMAYNRFNNIIANLQLADQSPPSKMQLKQFFGALLPEYKDTVTILRLTGTENVELALPILMEQETVITSQSPGSITPAKSYFSSQRPSFSSQQRHSFGQQQQQSRPSFGQQQRPVVSSSRSSHSSSRSSRTIFGDKKPNPKHNSDRCAYCKNFGHHISECRKRQFNNQQQQQRQQQQRGRAHATTDRTISDEEYQHVLHLRQQQQEEEEQFFNGRAYMLRPSLAAQQHGSCSSLPSATHSNLNRPYSVAYSASRPRRRIVVLPPVKAANMLLDSGATSHISPDDSVLFDRQPCNRTFETSNGPVTCHLKGTMHVTFACGTEATLEDTYYMPECKTFLLSETSLTQPHAASTWTSCTTLHASVFPAARFSLSMLPHSRWLQIP